MDACYAALHEDRQRPAPRPPEIKSVAAMPHISTMSAMIAFSPTVTAVTVLTAKVGIAVASWKHGVVGTEQG